MANISTSFMGINMGSPIIVGASTLSNHTDNIKRAEDAVHLLLLVDFYTLLLCPLK